MRYTATPRAVKWKDLSKQHEDARVRLEKSVQNFISGHSVAPIAIVGPYGSGKSELMCWGFQKAWKDYKIPAFMVNLEGLLKAIPASVSPGELVETLANIVNEQIGKLQELIEGDQFIPKGIYLPDVKHEGEILADYFSEICGVETFNFAGFKEILQNGKAVLFIDEMEQKYSELLQRVEVSDKAPLRGVFESVEKGLASYYLVMSFGLTSAYETLSGAEARRESTIYVPLPTPKNFASIIENPQAANLLWWASRGRAGWALKLWDSWQGTLVDSTTLEELRNVLAEPIESLPAVDVSRLGAISRSSTSAHLKQLLVTLQPFESSKFGVSSLEDFLNELQSSFCLFVARDLSSVDDLADAFINDLMRFTDSTSEVSRVLLSDHIRKILEAVANQERMLAFGGWRDMVEIFAKGAVVPLLILLHDMILEFEGDSSEGEKALEFLYAVMNEIGITGETVQDSWQVISRFPNTHRIFQQNYIGQESEVNYLQFSLHTIENLFPRLVVRPLLSLHQDAKTDLESQKDDLEGRIHESGSFFKSTIQKDEFEVEFLLIPSETLVGTLQTRFFQPQRQDYYLPHKKLFVVLNLGEATFQLDANQNSDIRILESLGKLHCSTLSEKRLRDFLLSLWHNVILLDEIGQLNDFQQIIQKLSTGEKISISKTARRTIEHYQSRVHERLSEFASKAVKSYGDNLMEVFNLTDFPTDRIKDASGRIREVRTVELVACAFDLCSKRENALNCLAQLKNMEKLQEESPRRGYGYKEFFDHYSVIRARGRFEPSAVMKDIVEYVRQNNSFFKLRDIARGLYFSPNATLGQLTENIADNPLELMFNGSTEHKIFLRGCFLSNFLDVHQEELVRQVQQLAIQLSNTQQGFEKLKKEVAELNHQIGHAILSDANVNGYLEELTAARKLLESPQEIPPSVLYVAYQFLKASLEQVEELRQKWSGEKGIRGWEDQLSEILELKDYLEDMEKELEEIYSSHTELKEEFFGSKKACFQEIKQGLQDAREKFFASIGSSLYELSDDIPEIAIDEVEEEKASIQEKIKGMRKLSQTVEQAVGNLSEIGTQLEALCKLMRGVSEL